MALRFVRDPIRFKSEIQVQSDHDSELGRRFGYVSRFDHDLQLPEHLRSSPYNLLQIAAYLGDLEFLYCLSESFGAILYDRTEASIALNHHRFDFFMKYVELAKGNFVQRKAYDMGCRNMPLLIIMECIRESEDDLLNLIRHVYDNVIVLLPLPEEIGQFDDLLISLNSSYDDFGCVRQFLVEERGLRFGDAHVRRLWRQPYRRIYTYVLDHLRLGLDRKTLQDRYPLQEITDLQLLEEIYWSLARFLQTDRPHSSEAKKADLTEMLFDNTRQIPKVIALCRYLSSPPWIRDVHLPKYLLDKMTLQEQFWELDRKSYACRMSAFLRDILVDWQLHWLTKVDRFHEPVINVPKFP